MPTLIKEQVDIYQLPKVDDTYSKDNSEVTIGDLHGNAMKLMFMLVKHGAVKGISNGDYQKLVEIYSKSYDKLTQQDLKEFNQLLDKLTFNPAIGIRLIGDELADRGSNDYFTLKILQKLRQNNVPVEITISNHSVEFVEACEKFKENKHLKPPMLQYGHASSLYDLQALIEKKLVSSEEILAIADTVYTPTLKAISYSLSEDNSEITIYSHAGIGLNNIKRLAVKLGVDYQDDSAQAIAKTIDQINDVVKKHVAKKSLHTLYTHEGMWAGYEGYVPETDPLAFIIWNRDYSKLSRPKEHHGYRINYVHGHDSGDLTKDNIYNLDGNLGKTLTFNQGEYTALYSPHNTISLAAEPEKTDSKSLTLDTKTQATLSSDEMPPVELSHSQKDPTVINLEDMQRIFVANLDLIDAKRKEFLARGEQDAFQAADKLYDTVKWQYDNLTKLKDKTPQDIEQFKKNCQTAINDARPVLEKHRGWKQILGHLALAVIGLGVFYAIGLAAYKISGAQFSIFKTDSHKKLDALEESLNNMTKPSNSQ
ncbi:Dot/Icm T4SS effector Wip [Legionella sp. W05-934-2]|jgi:hypothetical protein|uniref:Dot/Icm T4SS effector Wip n=1 Tax=Legionella sp. W05-934-2 TaxID=1198649 RepID=UPI003462AEC8